MIFYITLVSSDKPLTIGHLAETETLLQRSGMALAEKPVWLEPHKAADIAFSSRPHSAQIKDLRAFLHGDGIDVFVTPKKNRRKKLLLADMDSTILDGEGLDELAECAGIKKQVSEITERAMNGELDFKDSFRDRIKLLKNLPEEALQKIVSGAKLNKGAAVFVKTMRENGAQCVLVSGGLTFFTEAISKKAGFHHHHGNNIHIENNKLTGAVFEPVLDKDTKLQFLQQYRDELNLKAENILAIGDGANDLPMLEAAGLGIGYHPKAVLLEALDNCIIHGDFTAALYAQGYTTPFVIT